MPKQPCNSRSRRNRRRSPLTPTNPIPPPPSTNPPTLSLRAPIPQTCVPADFVPLRNSPMARQEHFASELFRRITPRKNSNSSNAREGNERGSSILSRYAGMSGGLRPVIQEECNMAGQGGISSRREVCKPVQPILEREMVGKRLDIPVFPSQTTPPCNIPNGNEFDNFMRTMAEIDAERMRCKVQPKSEVSHGQSTTMGSSYSSSNAKGGNAAGKEIEKLLSIMAEIEEERKFRK